MKKYLYGIAILIGISDISYFILNQFTYGWLELLFSLDFIFKSSIHLGIGIFLLGIWLIKKQVAIEKSEIDDITDLENDEKILFKDVNGRTIITVTNKKIIYRSYFLDFFKSSYNDLEKESKAIYLLNDIKSVESIRIKDILKHFLGKLSNQKFGISIQFNDDSVKNISTNKPDLICAIILKNLSN